MPPAAALGVAEWSQAKTLTQKIKGAHNSNAL